MFASVSARGAGSIYSDNPLSLSLEDKTVWEWYLQEAGARGYERRGGKQALRNYLDGPMVRWAGHGAGEDGGLVGGWGARMR